MDLGCGSKNWPNGLVRRHCEEREVAGDLVVPALEGEAGVRSLIEGVDHEGLGSELLGDGHGGGVGEGLHRDS